MTISTKLSEKEINLIEQFESLYNEIDRHMRKATGKERTVAFSAVVSAYCQKRKNWGGKEAFLRTVGDLRNCIIHEKTTAFGYCAVPAPMVVEKMEEILSQVKNPILVIPRFQKEVETVRMSDSIADVLKRIHEYQYSQFPVYDESGFKALLTENGITRWLASHVTKELSLVELAEATVRQALKQEERRKNWEFSAKDRSLDELRSRFAENNILEAVLITATGKPSETLLGIVTRWDMLET